MCHFTAFANSPYNERLSSVHISGCKYILYVGCIFTRLCCHIGSLVQLYAKCFGDIILCSKESCSNQNEFCRNLLFGSRHLYHISASGLLIHFALKAYNRQRIKLSALVLVEFFDRRLINTRICSETCNCLFLAIICL